MGTNKKNGKPDPLDAASFVIGNWYHWGAIDFPFAEVTKKNNSWTVPVSRYVTASASVLSMTALL